MRNNTFTPGPWEVGGIIGCYIEGRNSWSHVCNVMDAHEGSVTEEESVYNRHLIAAAPDMYDALWETIELSDRNLTEAGRTPECQRVYDIVRAALAKAEGE